MSAAGRATDGGDRLTATAGQLTGIGDRVTAVADRVPVTDPGQPTGLTGPVGPGAGVRATQGADLLTELRSAISRYVVMPSGEALDAVTLWVAATHLQPAWQHAPRLAVVGPAKRCGKSRLLDVLHDTVHDPFITVNSTPAAIFRSITEQPPTLLVDEADTIFGSVKVAEKNEEMRGLLNSGHQRNRPTTRVVGPEHKPTKFATFAMAALAGIGDLPDTIMDRAVVVRMRRRGPGESVRSFRSRYDTPVLHVLRDRLAAWLVPLTDAAAGMEPVMPVEDRAADTWEPLVAGTKPGTTSSKPPQPTRPSSTCKPPTSRPPNPSWPTSHHAHPAPRPHSATPATCAPPSPTTPTASSPTPPGPPWPPPSPKPKALAKTPATPSPQSPDNANSTPPTAPPKSSTASGTRLLNTTPPASEPLQPAPTVAPTQALRSWIQRARHRLTCGKQAATLSLSDADPLPRAPHRSCGDGAQAVGSRGASFH